MRSIIINDADWDAWHPQHGAHMHKRHAHGHAASQGKRGEELAPWLPVPVFRAAWSAELVAGAPQAQAQPPQWQQPEQELPSSAAAAASACSAAAPWQLLRCGGLPVLAASATATQSSLSGPATGQHYRLTSWQASCCPSLQGMWSSYYHSNPRTPDDVTLAPWVAQRYRKYKKFAARLDAAAAAEQQMQQ